MTRMWRSGEHVKACDNRACDRWTTARYCCGACSTADGDGFELHEDGPLSHSEGCNERHRERGPVEWRQH